MSKTSCLLFFSRSDFAITTDFLPIRLNALAEFKAVLAKFKKQTIRELSRKTLDSIGAKFLIVSTVLHAYKKKTSWDVRAMLLRHGGPVENCVDPISFECVDVRELCQIIANLIREHFAEREAENNESPLDTDKERPCTSQMQSWTTCLACQKKLCFVSMLSRIKTVMSSLAWKTKMNQEGRLCECWRSIFQARI